MKTTFAQFTLYDGSGTAAIVSFNFNPKGEPTNVHLFCSGKEFRVSNKKARWKPCVTHCLDLIRMHLGKKPTSEFAKQRVKATKPELKVHG